MKVNLAEAKYRATAAPSMRPTSQRLLQVQPGEVRITNAEKKLIRIWGKHIEIARQLNQLLGDPGKTGEETKELGGVLFIRRKTHSNTIWVFAEVEIEKVAKLLGTGIDKVVLSEVQPNEVRISNTDKQLRRIWGTQNKIARQLNDMLGDPERTWEERKELGGVLFIRRMIGFSKIWTFAETEIEKVAKLLGTGVDEVLLSETRPDEVLITTLDKRLKRIWGNHNIMAKKLNNMLGDPERTWEERKELGGVLFIRRKSGSSRIWTFAEAEIEKVAALLGTGIDEVLLDEAQPGEILISTKDKQLTRIWGKRQLIARQLNKILGDPEKTWEEKKELGGVVFVRRICGTRKAWVFAETEIEKVAAFLGTGVDEVVLSEAQPWEVRISMYDKRLGMMQGGQVAITRFINKILGDPGRTREEKKEWEGIIFTRRRSWNNRNWTFDEMESEKLEKNLIKAGVINIDKVYFWLEEYDQGELIGHRLAGIGRQMVGFDSKQERTIALLLHQFGYLPEFRQNVELQVKANHGSRHAFDFMITMPAGIPSVRVIIEHHPNYVIHDRENIRAESDYINLLAKLEDPQAQEELLQLYTDLVIPPRGGAAQRILARYAAPIGADYYDIRRLILMELNESFHDCLYIRTRTVEDLFDHFLWPYYYLPQDGLSKAQAREKFKQVVREVEAKIQEFDRWLLPQLTADTADVIE